ncbi:ras GTPase-activating protein-binding protein 2 isoform X2 [Xyrauchen texanus]|uniref:ras GTPase-activating protein-binding protein 2 isoform X2 n=1 Tax=Xyrauchen texanus TaxID=154827 RepID=UPI002241FD57|nr:ras GTPase-activating protein-binding protein 2 isoform X2 [Xyrauchen texanus]
MVMEKPSPLLVGREFVRQYYTLLNKAPDFLHRFYGQNSSYVHGGLDSNGKLSEAVYGQAEIHKMVMSLKFSECHTKIQHVDAHATLSDGVVVQVMGELSNNGQPMRKFLQTFVLAPEGSVTNKFYVHNDIFRYEDEVFGDSEAELDEESEEETDELEEPDTASNANYCEPHPVSINGVEETLVKPPLELDSEAAPEPKLKELKFKAEEKVPEEFEEEAPSPVPVESPQNIQETPKTFSWASVTSKNLPLSGTVPTSGGSAHAVKAPNSQSRVEAKPETSSASIRPRDQRVSDRPSVSSRGTRSDGSSAESQTGKPYFSFINKGRGDESGEMDGRRVVRYPDSHQLFVGNLPHDIDERELKDCFMTFGNVVELRINTKGTGGKLPNFGFVVFDDSEPVQRILGVKPIMFRGEVRLNVEEKKTKVTRERDTRGGEDRRDPRRGDRGPAGPRGVAGSGMMRERDGRGPPSRGATLPKPAVVSGRGTGTNEGRFTAQRR